MAKERIILIPVEDNEESLRALDWTLKEVYKEGDTVCFLHIVTTQRPFGSGMFPSSEPNSPLHSETESFEMLEREHARGFIQDRFVPVVQDALVNYKVLVLKGMSNKDIGLFICQKAEEVSAAVLVITASKVGGVACYYEGSHVEYCIRNCSSPVLVWRP